MPLTPGVHHIEVDGGALAVEVLPGSTEPVLAIHGISSQRKLWNWLRAEDPSISLIAVDLRGRADSIDVKGDSSVDQHADDLIAVLDSFGIDAIHVCGMSMGGFIAVNLALRYPSRVKSIVLVDGGFPMTQPPGLTKEMLPAVFADRLGRLEQRWDSINEYAQFFTANTAPLLDPNDPLVLDYLVHDLREGLVRLSGDALLQDAASVFFGTDDWRALTHPVRYLYAEWSSGATADKPATPGAYTDELIAMYSEKCVSVRYVPGVDHAASIMSMTGAAVTAELIREALA